jgi:hypothetical protein
MTVKKKIVQVTKNKYVKWTETKTDHSVPKNLMSASNSSVSEKRGGWNTNALFWIMSNSSNIRNLSLKVWRGLWTQTWSTIFKTSERILEWNKNQKFKFYLSQINNKLRQCVQRAWPSGKKRRQTVEITLLRLHQQEKGKFNLRKNNISDTFHGRPE